MTFAKDCTFDLSQIQLSRENLPCSEQVDVEKKELGDKTMAIVILSKEQSCGTPVYLIVGCVAAGFMVLVVAIVIIVVLTNERLRGKIFPFSQPGSVEINAYESEFGTNRGDYVHLEDDEEL